MTATVYVPTPGSVPARVVAFIARLKDGAAIQTNVLVDELGINAASLLTSVDAAIRENLVTREQVDGRYWWRRGRALEFQEPALDYGPIPTKRVRAESAAPPAPASEIEIPVFTPKPAPAPVPRPAAAPPEPKGPWALKPLGWLAPPAAAPAPEPDADDPPSGAKAATAPVAPEVGEEPRRETAASPQEVAPMRFALWSDGSLQVEANRQLYATFSPDETRALIRYLERVLTREGAE